DREVTKTEGLKLDLKDFTSGGRSASAMKEVKVSLQTFEGETHVQASGTGLRTAVVLNPNLVNVNPAPGPGGPRPLSATFAHMADCRVQFRVTGKPISPILDTQYNQVRQCDRAVRLCSGGDTATR